MSTKKQLIEPIGTMCRLIALVFRKIGTKISIYNHAIFLQSPEKTELLGINYQGLTRRFYGDGKEEISELFMPIIRIIKWYLIPGYNKFNKKIDIKSKKENTLDDEETDQIDIKKTTKIVKDDKNQLLDKVLNKQSSDTEFVETEQYYQTITKLVGYFCRALNKLQKTYVQGNVVLALQFYINILNDSLNGKFSEELLPAYLLEQELQNKNFLDYDKIRSLWSYKKLDLVRDIYDKCFKLLDDKNEPISENIADRFSKTIENVLDLTDEEFRKYITQNNLG